MKTNSPQGFVLPLTLLICVIIITISTGISTILAKELYFSKVSRESKKAYAAADSATMCAITVDDQYVDPDTGLGIFPYNPLGTPEADMQTTLTKFNQTRTTRGLSSLLLQDIQCATSPIVTNITFTPFSRITPLGVSESGWTSTFPMTMNLGGGAQQCATVIVSKTASYRQIIARGFAACSGSSQSVERAVVTTLDTK